MQCREDESMSEFDWGFVFGCMFTTFGLMILAVADRWRSR